MAKLYFKYGAMGSSKTAQALIAKFNYEERGMKTWLIKPATDRRDGENVVRSRIGLESAADVMSAEDSIIKSLDVHGDTDVIIVDECQFLTEKQIDELREIVDFRDIPVLCFGLRTDFRTRMFTGSRRLFEVADSITEIKTMCSCGAKAIVNARLIDGMVVTEGEQIFLGGNDSYLSMCHKCWKKRIKEQENKA